MGEPLVLASVTIDESGVVNAAGNMNSALEDSEQKFQNVERASRGTVDQLNHMVDHMYSLSSITRIVTHSFGLLALAIEAKRIIESTDAFKNLKESLSEVGNILTGVTDAAGATANAVDKILSSVSADLVDKQAEDLKKTNDAIDKLNEARERLTNPVEAGNFLDQLKSMFTSGPENAAAIGKIDEGVQKLQGHLTEVVAAGSERGGFYKAAGIVPPEDLADKISEIDLAEDYFNEKMQHHTITAERYAEAIKHLEESRAKLLNTEKEADFQGKAFSHQKVGPGPDSALAFAGIPSQAEIDAAVNQTLASLQALSIGLATGQVTTDEASNAYSRLRQKLTDAGVSAQITMNIMGDLGLDIQDAADDADNFREKFVGAMEGSVAAIAILNAAIAVGLGGSAAATRLKMALQAAEDEQKGISELGAAAEAAGTPGLQWAAPLHYIAAGLYFAAAAKAGIGAITGQGAAAGAGGSSKVGSPRGGGVSAAPTGFQRQPNLTVIVQGHVIGQEQWLRGAIVQIQRSLGDGTGGGGF